MSVPGRIALLLLFACELHGSLAAETTWKGATLRDYIASLHDQHLRILYSTDLVPDHFRVLEEPTTRQPLAALREVLAPYGLQITDGPGGSLLITKGESAGFATVSIKVTSDGGPGGIRAAEIAVDGEMLGRTGADGNLSVSRVAAGDHQLRVTAEGYRDAAPTAFSVTPGVPVALSVALARAAEPLTEIIVTSSQYNLRYERSGSHTFLDRELTTTLPDIGDEVLRAVARLPGTAGNGVSTRNHVRGGVQNEQLFLVDGLRLYEPYHLKDFHSVATIVDQNVVAGIDFYSAGYQARYGDRMSGVVDISLREPAADIETTLALSFFNASLSSLGRFGGGDRGDWLFSARRGNLDLLADAINPEYGGPRYEDLIVHVGWQFGRTNVSANGLYSYDKITIAQLDGSEKANARYQNVVLWLKAESDWTDSFSSSTILSATDIDNTRTGTAEKPGILSGAVADDRNFRSLALSQDWQYDLTGRWALTAGGEIKRLEAGYEYESNLAISAPFDRILDNESTRSRANAMAPEGAQYGVYVESRWQPTGWLTLDAGLRWDQQTYTTAASDEQLSPRFNVLVNLGPNTELRAAFGEYYQAQEINELQIADGETAFHPAQRAQHFVASLVHGFDSGLDGRLEFYRKTYRSLIPRYENVFDPLVLLPELQIDRVQMDADSAIARGVELTLSSDDTDSLVWWASLAWSDAEDTVQGIEVKRSWDQTETLKAGLSRDWRKWNFSAAGIVHRGWPKTILTGEAVVNPDGTSGLSVATSERNRLRHAVFQSLDARVSRRFDVSRGELTAFLEITNLYNRKNPCCTEYSVVSDDSGIPFIAGKEGYWLPLVPSLGVTWRF